MSTTVAAPTTAAPAAGAQPTEAGQAQNAPVNSGTGATQAAGGQPKPPVTAAEVRKLKLKLEGQDVELPESEVIALAQQGRTAAKRFQEAAAYRKQAEDILKAAEENPAEFFTKRGKDARKWAEEYLLEQIQREAMSPEQKKAAENEKRLKEYEAQDKKAKDEARQKEMADLQKKHMQNYDKLFVEALTDSGLPKTAYTVKRMAELQLVNLRKGLELDAKSLAKIVREDYISEQKQLFGAMDGDALMDALGPDVVKKLSKAQIAKLKARSATGQFSGKSPTREAAAAEEPMSWKELQRRNRMRPS